MVSLAGAGQLLGAQYLPALRYPDYRKLWGATLCSQSSAWALIVARGTLVFTLTGSPVWAGIVTYTAMIPSIVVAPFAGFLADRFDRRTVLAWAYAVNFSHNLLLALLVVSGTIEPWHLVLLSLLNGTARATQMPAAQALLPNTLPRERLFNAIALYQATMQGARFTGALLILVLLWLTDERQDWVFFLCTGLYIVGLSLILTIRTSSRGVVEKGKGMVFRNLLAGLHFMYHHPLILSLILLTVLHCGMTMSFESLFPVLSRDKLGMEPGAGFLLGFSYLMLGYGGAAMLVALGLGGVQSERVRGRLFPILGILSGLTPIALAYSPNLPTAVLATTAMGASQAGFMTLINGMVQAIAPDAIRGRLMSVNSWHIQGFMATFNLVNGALASFTPLTASLILGAGGVGFVLAIGASFARAPLRWVYRGGAPAEASAA